METESSEKGDSKIKINKNEVDEMVSLQLF